MKGALLDLGANLYGAAWEARRRAYARGLLHGRRVPARVVSIGNLTVGGAGKTTLTLELAKQARRAGHDVAVVCRRYHPGPRGLGDEEMLYRAALPEGQVFAGDQKRALAAEAAVAGRRLILVDDGFSHWPLERDLDIVLLDASDPWGEGRLIPAGRLREPKRALQRAEVVVLSRVARDQDPAPLLAEARRVAPGARLAAGRHRVTCLRRWDGAPVEPTRAAWVVTGTGNPRAVERSAVEAGLEVRGLSVYRDHHWFRVDEARRELTRASAASADLVLTAKDAVRWPDECVDPALAVMEVEWEWIQGGEEIERLAIEGEDE